MSDEQTNPRREDWEDIADNVSQLLANLRSDVQAFQLPWPESGDTEVTQAPGWPTYSDELEGRCDDAKEGESDRSDAESVDTTIHLGGEGSSEFATHGVATQESSIDALKIQDPSKPSTTGVGADEGMSQATENARNKKRKPKRKRGGKNKKGENDTETSASQPAGSSLNDTLDTLDADWRELYKNASRASGSEGHGDLVDPLHEQSREASRRQFDAIHRKVLTEVTTAGRESGMSESDLRDQAIAVELLSLQYMLGITSEERLERETQLKQSLSPEGQILLRSLHY